MATAGDSVAVVALVDSIVGAKDDEIFALETRLAVVLTENDLLWRSKAQADSVIATAILANDLLHGELDAANRRGDSWEKAANRGSLIKWGERALFAGYVIFTR